VLNASAYDIVIQSLYASYLLGHNW